MSDACILYFSQRYPAADCYDLHALRESHFLILFQRPGFEFHQYGVPGGELFSPVVLLRAPQLQVSKVALADSSLQVHVRDERQRSVSCGRAVAAAFDVVVAFFFLWRCRFIF